MGINCMLPSNVKIGDNVMMGPQCFFLAFNHAYKDKSKSIRSQGYTDKKVTRIGNDVWIGREVLFTPGRTVKDGTVTVTREAHPGADVLNREQAQELLLSPLASKGSKVPSEIWKNIPSDWFPLPLYCATADEF